ARLAQRDQWLLQAQGQRRREQKAARLDGRDGVDRWCRVVLDHAVDGVLERPRLGQERRDVLEQDARPGEGRDVADVFRQVHSRLPFLSWRGVEHTTFPPPRQPCRRPSAAPPTPTCPPSLSLTAASPWRRSTRRSTSPCSPTASSPG